MTMGGEEIEKLRKPWEIEDHWVLRRDFMLANEDMYSKDRLQCLAQAFVNVEILGTTYDEATMEEIKVASNRVQSLPEFRRKKEELSREERFKPPPKKPRQEQLGTRNVAGHQYFNQQQRSNYGYNNQGNQHEYQQYSNRSSYQQQQHLRQPSHPIQSAYGYSDSRSNYQQGYNQQAASASYSNRQQPYGSYPNSYGNQGYNYNQQPRYGLQSSYAPRHNYTQSQSRNPHQQAQHQPPYNQQQSNARGSNRSYYNR